MADMASNKDVYTYSETHWGDTQKNLLSQTERDMIARYMPKSGRILEAGCGGGRISQYLCDNGFENIDSFDFIEGFIESAKSRNLPAHFFVADAANLSMLDSGQYDGLLYLAQVICFVPYERIPTALRESYRVCRDGGTAVFSFLDYDSRKINRVLSFFLGVLRKIRHENLSPRQLPWLRQRGKMNYAFWKKGQATNYWFTRDEIHAMLMEIGYHIVETFPDSRMFRNEKMLYVVCRK